jgi:hypothetical protein
MTVKRLRPLPSLEQLAAMYPAPHDHRIYGRGHHERVEATIALALQHVDSDDRDVVGDLSCGNAEIAMRIAVPPSYLHLGDFAVLPADLPGTKYCGQLEQTINLMPEVGTYICSETIEHLDDPFGALVSIWDKASMLVLSTPIGCWDDANGEHLWAWDRDGVEQLLDSAGFEVVAFDHVDSTAYGEPYDYGIWVAEAAR